MQMNAVRTTERWRRTLSMQGMMLVLHPRGKTAANLIPLKSCVLFYMPCFRCLLFKMALKPLPLCGLSKKLKLDIINVMDTMGPE